MTLKTLMVGILKIQRKMSKCVKCVNNSICDSIINEVFKKHEKRIFEDLVRAIPAKINISFDHKIIFEDCGNFNKKN